MTYDGTIARSRQRRGAGLLVRRAKLSDRDAILRLEKNEWPEPGLTGDYETAPLIHFGYAYVAISRPALVGVLLAMPTRGGDVYVTEVCTLSEFRRQGIATRLYQRLFSDTGMRRVIAFVDPDNRPSLQLHRHLGFRAGRLTQDMFGLGRNGRRVVLTRVP